MSGVTNCFKPDDTDVRCGGVSNCFTSDDDAVGEDVGRLDLHELDLVLSAVDAPLPAGR